MKKILVVDDEDIMRTILCDILKSNEYLVDDASNGVEALKKLKDGGFNLVISDIEMPVMTGIKLAREMRLSGLSIPLILMSGNATPHLKEIAALADYFLLKPFEFNDLLSIVERALGE